MIHSGMFSLLSERLSFQMPAVLGQSAVRFTEWSFPTSPTEWVFLLGVLAVLIVSMIELYRRDTRDLAMAWRILLPTLRLIAIIGLLIVFLNPRTRTQTWSQRPSRVAVLVDVSSSMQNPADDPSQEQTGSSKTVPTRFEKVVEFVRDQPWLNNLRKKHEVAIYTFDKSLSSRIVTLQKLNTDKVASTENKTGGKNPEKTETEKQKSEPPDWEEVFQPTGDETRLGESVIQLMREMNGQTLAGIVVVSDGGANAGIDVQSSNDIARQLNVRLFALGTGGIKPPVNLELAKLVAPRDVQLGDPFDIEAYVKGTGLAGSTVHVKLLMKEQGAQGEPVVIDEQEITLLEDQIPVQVTFPQTPTEEGKFEYIVRSSTGSTIQEVKTDDNERLISINAFERPVKVLIFAGGPSWDYRFLCGTLNRNPGFNIDVVLQTGGVGISQDVDNILFEFPKEKSVLYQYDVVICFDPDWNLVPQESRHLFEQWVSEEGGGAIFVAGDINTPLLANSQQTLPEILYLHPVFLDTVLPGIDMVNASTQVRSIELTPEGIAAPLLQVTEDPQTSYKFWEEFLGFYRFYPTTGPKSGASVYAYAGGVGALTESEPPILLASQFYGQGRTFYIGSSEFYRLRAEDPKYFERFWTRIGRESAQNRMRRGNTRGTLLIDRQTLSLGEMIKVRAGLLDADFEPFLAKNVIIEVEQPNGRLLVPQPQLRPNPAQPGRYVGEIRGSQPGRYQIRLRIPGTNQLISESVLIELPNLESKDLRQNIRQLQTLVAKTGGQYRPLNEAESILKLLPDSSEPFLLSEQIKTLWDRSWLMCCIVALFGIEWLSRKLLKLA